MTSASVRWFFDVSRWRPTAAEWRRAMRCLAERAERQRIRQFRYAHDAKASLAGALLLRRLAAGPMGISRPTFLRSQRGRPTVADDADTDWDYNISHHGSLVVLAAEKGSSVGVDVMRFSAPRSDVDEFFRLMRRQFTEDEWSQILDCGGHDGGGNHAPNDSRALFLFNRFWCLKESFVKAQGSGLNSNLQRLSFWV